MLICSFSTYTNFQNISWWFSDYTLKYLQNISCFPHEIVSTELLGICSSTITTVYSFDMFCIIYHEVTWLKNCLNYTLNNIQWPSNPETPLLVSISIEGHFHWFSFMEGLNKGISTSFRYLPANIDHDYIPNKAWIHVLLLLPPLSQHTIGPYDQVLSFWCLLHAI